MSNKFFNGEVEFTYDGKLLCADVTAHGTYTFVKGRRYMPNGDPGYPDEEDFEIDDLEVNSIYDTETGERVEYIKDMYEAIEAAAWEADGWEDIEYEPDYDDYEERAMARWERDLDRAGL